MKTTGNNTPNKNSNAKSGEKIPQHTSPKRKTPKQVMDNHVKDEEHVITEEEFRNLKTGVDQSPDTTHEPLEIKDEKDRPKDEDKDPKIITPWDVIS